MPMNDHAIAALSSQRHHTIQLGRLLADPLLGLWIDERTIDAFVADELARLDPYSAQIAEAEAAYWRLVYAAPFYEDHAHDS